MSLLVHMPLAKVFGLAAAPASGQEPIIQPRSLTLRLYHKLRGTIATMTRLGLPRDVASLNSILSSTDWGD
jgi:hypothetical protein